MTDPAIEHAKLRQLVPMRKRGNWTDGPCFYVTVISGPRWAALAGPFRTHEEALAKVDACRELAQKADAFAWFYAYGTAKLSDGHAVGRFNQELEL